MRWTPAHNVHLTLRFLGDTDDGQLPALREALDHIADESGVFELSLAAVGAFPNARRPRVIWVGVDETGLELSRLQKKVERAARDHGWEREARSFTPHLTLGRVRPQERAADDGWKVAAPAMRFQVRELVLFESRLKPTGAEYLPLHRAEFGD